MRPSPASIRRIPVASASIGWAIEERTKRGMIHKIKRLPRYCHKEGSQQGQRTGALTPQAIEEEQRNRQRQHE